jgi:Ca2+-binding RTX toxin-like protein
MLNRMFTYLVSTSVRRFRAVAGVTSGALFAGLMVTAGADPSVAQVVDPSVLCGMCLTETSALAVSITGSSKVTVNGGGVYANSNAAPAVSVTGSSKIVSNAQVRAVGTIVKTGSSTISGTPAAGLVGPLFVDPYSSRALVLSVGPNNAVTDFSQSGGTIPVRADGAYRDVSLNGSGTFVFPDAHRYRDVTIGGSVTATLKPGRYRNVTFGGSSKITLMPGVYWLAGSLNVTSSSKVTGTDAKLVLACGTAANDTRACNNETGGRLVVTGSSQLTLNGNTPTTPAISFVPGNIADITVDGSSKVVLANSGIDAPSTPIVVTGSSSITTAGVIHARRVSVTGSSTITATVIPTPPATTTTTVAASTTTISSSTTTTSPATTSVSPTTTSATTIASSTSTSTSSSTTTTVSPGTFTTTSTTTTTTTTVPQSACSPGEFVCGDPELDPCVANPKAVVGTAGADVIVGTAGDDVICGLGGDDRIDGGGGDDEILGGNGNDLITGGPGDDHMNGGAGADTIWGGDGADGISGSDGPDELLGEAGPDLLIGGPGNDFLNGGGNLDTLAGSDGDDRLSGGDGVDLLDGGIGTDIEVMPGGSEDSCWLIEAPAACVQKGTASPVLSPLQIAPLGIPGFSISATMVGDVAVAGDLSVSRLDPVVESMDEFAAGPMVSIRLTGRSVYLSSAVIQLPVDPSIDLGEVGVFTRADGDSPWTIVNEGVSVALLGHGFSVATTHFSDWATFRRSQPQATVSRFGYLPRSTTMGCVTPWLSGQVGVVLIADSSGSAADLAVKPADYAQRIRGWLPSPKVVITGLNSNEGPFNPNLETVDLGTFGSTRWSPAVRNAILNGLETDAFRQRVLVLVGDGQANDSAAELQALSAFAVDHHVAVDFVALGAPSFELAAFVSGTGGTIVPAGSPEEVARKVSALTFDNGSDQDADGLTDCEESNGVLAARGPGQPVEVVSSNSGNRQSDDDGLADGDELIDGSGLPWLMRTSLKAGRQVRFLRSYPSISDSDGDLASDFFEFHDGTLAVSPIFAQPNRSKNSVLDKFKLVNDADMANWPEFDRQGMIEYITKFSSWDPEYDKASDAALMGKMVFDVTNELDDFKKNASDALGLFGKVAQALGLNLNVNTDFNKLYFDKPFADRRSQLVGMAAIRNLQQVISLGKEVHNSLIRLALQSRIVELTVQIGALRLANLGFVRLLAGLEAGAMAAAAAAKMAILVSSKGYFVAGFSVSIGDAVCEISGRCPPPLKLAMKALAIWFQATTTTKLALAKARSGYNRGIGSGSGPWVDEATNIQPGGAIGQITDTSCVSACGEMLSGVAQAQLLEHLTDKVVQIDDLARLLGPPWRGGGLTEEAALLVARNGQVGLDLLAPGQKLSHMVVSTPLSGDRFLIQDPWAGGSNYIVDAQWIVKYVTGAVFR